MFAKELTPGQMFTMPQRRDPRPTVYTTVSVRNFSPLTTVVYRTPSGLECEVTVPSLNTVYPV